MAALKKSTNAKATDTVAVKPAAQKAASLPARKATNHRRNLRSGGFTTVKVFAMGRAAKPQVVTFGIVGGFKVFGSPVQPVHRTALQIEEAVAEFN